MQNSKPAKFPEMKITATCVRLPILRSHSESILVETEKKLMPKEAIKLWEQAGLKVQNKEEAGGYPTPREVTKTFNTHIGRVREDLSSEKALCFWCVADAARFIISLFLVCRRCTQCHRNSRRVFFSKKPEPIFKET